MRVLLLALLAMGLGAQVPETRRVDFVETLHGLKVPDPYRWLEDQDAPETRQWIERQNVYTRSQLEKLPHRESIRKRLDELSGGAFVGAPNCVGKFCYVSRRAAGAQAAIVYRRERNSSEEKSFFDPIAFAPGKGVSAAMMSVSDDGHVLAYALRRGGEDELEIRFRDVEKGEDLPVRIGRHLNRGFALLRDGKGCYYTNHDRTQGPRIKYLDLASGAERAVFGEGFSPSQFISPRLIAKDRYLLITASQGWASNDLYWQDRGKTDNAVKPIVRGFSAHFNAVDGGDRLLIQTDWDAPKYRVFSTAFDAPEQKNWKQIVAEGTDPIERVTVAGGKLFLEHLHNVTSRITVHSLDGKATGEVPLPGLGSAGFNGRPDERTAYLTFTNFATPSTTFEYDTQTAAQKIYFRTEAKGWDSDKYEVKQVWCTSKDGTKVPMFVAHRKGLAIDGKLPVALNGYGGFNVSLLPNFSSTAAVWMEHGGVWALANIRGGAEFGEAWHRAGMLKNKQNVFDDFIAAAEWLVANKYTNPKRLAIIGGSNGGLLVGAALTQRPDLYKAVLCSYPDLDMVGYWRFPNNNKPALLEYGDASKEEEFKFLIKYSPYQNVKEKAAYPAVLLTSGDRDTRVPPLQARKMTARLQAATTSGLPVMLHYDTEAGHVGAALRSQALEGPVRNLSFLFWQLGVE